MGIHEEYFRYRDAQDATPLRPEYLSHTLTISHTPETTDMCLLSPQVVTADGEWGAWYLAHRLAGAVR